MNYLGENPCGDNPSCARQAAQPGDFRVDEIIRLFLREVIVPGEIQYSAIRFIALASLLEPSLNPDQKGLVSEIGRALKVKRQLVSAARIKFLKQLGFEDKNSYRVDRKSKFRLVLSNE